MALQHQRQEGTDGGYRMVSWDDAVGHAVIWEYDADDTLKRRGVITHWPPERVEGEATGEVIWHDADGSEVERRSLTTVDALSAEDPTGSGSST